KYYPPALGGIESHTRTLARAQAALGARVEVLCVNHADGAGRDVVSRTFARTPTEVSRDGDVRVVRVGRSLSVRRFDVCTGLLAHLEALRRSPPDVLHVHAPNATMVLALAALPAFSRCVVTHHSDIVHQQVLHHALRPFEQLAYGRAARVLVTSLAYADGSKVLQRFRRKVAVLPLGIELRPLLEPTENVLRHARRWREAVPGPLWLMVGRLVYYKGVDVALRALREVPGTLRVVGTGPLRAELERQARVLGVAPRVQWMGGLEDEELAGAYRAATALWFPSTARSEAFGLVQVEALASGLPVINTCIPGSGVDQVSLDGVTGLTVPPGDHGALAAAA
ncbi:MAG: glycosyltransferase, partial [Myxococcaceae bacterium]|nr:glycosyltransferase [Myxococcaceae bacterium]